VIEVQNGKKTGVGTLRAPCAGENPAKSMLLSRSLKSAVARPRIHSLKIAEHELRTRYVTVAHDRREPLCLVAALEDRGTQMDVVKVQRGALRGNVHALHSALLARLPRQIVFDVL